MTRHTRNKYIWQHFFRLSEDHDNIALIVGTLESELETYEQDGVFGDDAFRGEERVLSGNRTRDTCSRKNTSHSL